MGRETNLNNPFIIVNGGVSFGSLQQIGEVLPSRSFGAAKIQPYVDIGNAQQGALMLRTPVIDLKEQIPIQLCFYYDSKAADPTNAWHFSHRRFKKLPAPRGRSPADLTAILIEQDGREVNYTLDLQQPENYWWAPKQVEGTPFLSYDETQQLWFLFDFKTRAKEYYDQIGNLIRYEDAVGRVICYEYKDRSDSHALTAIIPPSNNRYELVRKQTPEGYSIAFLMKNPAGDQSKILQTQIFNKNNQLIETNYSSINGVDQYVVNYLYEHNGFLNMVLQSDGTVIGFAPDLENNLREISIGNSSIALTQITFEYSKDRQTDLPVIIFTAAQTTNSISLDDKGRICKVSNPVDYPRASFDQTPVPDETLYSYDANGRVKTIVHPSGATESFEYFGEEGLLARHVGANGQKTEYFYEVSDKRHFCKSIVRYVDDQPQITRRIYDYNYKTNKAFLRFEISPAMRVTEYRPDDWDNLGKVITYLDDFYVNQPALQPGEAPNLSTMLSWVKTKNPQSISLTEYIYDIHQHSQVMLTYRYGHIDTHGNGVNDQLMNIERTDRDVFGNLTHYVSHMNNDGDSALNYQLFDYLNRLTKIVDPFEQETIYTYIDNQHKVVAQQPNGRIEVVSYDSKDLTNEVVQTVSVDGQQQTRLTKYTRDDSGRPVYTDLPDGRRVITFFDHQARLGFTINPSGAVEENRYDLQKRFNTKIRYVNRIDPQELIAKGEGYLPTIDHVRDTVVADTALDRYSYEFFDASNRLCWMVDEENYATQIIYDDLDRQVAKITYAAQLKEAQLEQLKNKQNLQLPFDASKDRGICTFYDADNLKIATQDAAGYITEYIYDAGKRLRQKIVYTTRVELDFNKKTFSLIRPVRKPEDPCTYYFYDARNRLILEIDPEDCITTTDYWANELVSEKKRYANKVSVSLFNNTTLPLSLPNASPEDQVTTYQYDELDRQVLLQTSDNKGQSTVYDNMGNIVAQTTKDLLSPDSLDPDKKRSLETRCDGWEQVVAEANALVAQKLMQPNADQAAIWRTLTERHTYDASGLKLKTAVRANETDQQDQLTYYYYDQQRRPILTIKVLADQTTVIQEKTYDSFNAVTAIRRYSRSLAPEAVTTLTGGFVLEVLRRALDNIKDDAKDAVTHFAYNKRGLLTQTTDAEGYLFSKKYNAFKECEEEGKPVASKQPTLTIKHEFDPRGLEIKTSRISGDLITQVLRRFDNPYGKLTETIDEINGRYQTKYDRRGDVSQTINALDVVDQRFTRDAFGRVLSKTDATDQVVRHTYDQAQRTHAVEYPIVGTKTLQQSNVFDETIKTTDALGNFERWEHAPDGQITKHVDANANATIDSFNLRGWHTKHIDKNLSETTFDYNHAGLLVAKTVDAQHLRLKTQYERDALGNAKRMIDPRLVVTENSFDRRGLLVKTVVDPTTNTTPGLNLITQIEYNGQQDKVSEKRGDITTEDQSFITFQYDGLGRAIGKTVDPITATRASALNFKTEQTVNGLGFVIAEKDANGNLTRTFYNALGQKRVQVNAEAQVTEWEYKPTGKLFYERRYELPLDLAQFNTLSDNTTLQQVLGMLHTHLQDTLTYYFYDQNQRERFQINALWEREHNKLVGVVLEKRYDNASRVSQTIGYAAKIADLAAFLLNGSIQQWVSLIQSLANPAKDRFTHYILDPAGQQRFVIDSLGAVVEQRFNASGQIITKLAYAGFLAEADVLRIAQLPADQVAEQLHFDPQFCRTTYYVFDTAGRPLYIVNPELGVTRFAHDTSGNLTEEHQHSYKLNLTTDNYADLLNKLMNIQISDDAERITKKTYDHANRITAITDALNNPDQFVLNALGDTIKHIDREGNAWLYTYDRAQRLITETAPPALISMVTMGGDGKLALQQQMLCMQKIKEYDGVGNITRLIEGRCVTPDFATVLTSEERIFKSTYDRCSQLNSTVIENIAIDDVDKATNFSQRPEKTVTLTTKVVRNARRLKVAEQDESGHWAFTLYDEKGLVIYTVDALGAVVKIKRNAFGEVTHEIRYAKPIVLDFDEYIDSGIPRGILELAIQVDPQADRITNYERDRRGDVAVIRKGPVFSFSPTTNLSGEFHQETFKIYNAFRECIYQVQTIDATTDAEQYRSFNRCGKIILEINPMFYPKTYLYNAFGDITNSTEHCSAITQPLNPQMTYADLTTHIIKSDSDRIYGFGYDNLGQKVYEMLFNATYQTMSVVSHAMPVMSSTTEHLVYLNYQYNKTGHLITKRYSSDGAVFDSFYFDARGFKKSETSVSRKVFGSTDTLTPLTHYGIDAHGQTVSIKRFKHGANSQAAPVAVDAADQLTLSQFDSRGLERFQQDPKGNLRAFTYTPTRKKAREFWRLKNNDVEHIDEARFTFDALDRSIFSKIYRNNRLLDGQVTQIQYNVFGEAIGEGPGNNSFPLYRHFDRVGQMWSTNAEGGVPTLLYYDLAGRETLRVQSPVNDLNQITYAGLSAVLQQSIQTAERTETRYDLAGHVVARSLPASYVNDAVHPDNVPLNVYASALFNNIGRISLSWLATQEQNVRFDFSLWPLGHPEASQILEIKNQDGHSGVDVSNQPSDVYEYKLSYFALGTNQLQYVSTGTVQVDTANVQQSRHLVVVRESDSVIRLTGKTDNLGNQIELWQQQQKVATLLINNLRIDLSNYHSGIYQLKPIIEGQNPPLSLPFTVYTTHPADQPLGKQYHAEGCELLTLDTHGQLKWPTPVDFVSRPVKIICKYLDDQDNEQTHEDVIEPNTDKGHYTDKEEHALICNTEFAHPVKVIQKLTLMLQINNNTNPDFLTFFKSEEPISTPPEEFDAELTQLTKFSSQDILYVTPSLGLLHPPTITFLDTSLGRFSEKKQISATGITTEGFTLDITDLPPGIYPFKIDAPQPVLANHLESSWFDIGAVDTLAADWHDLDKPLDTVLAATTALAETDELSLSFVVGQPEMVFASVDKTTANVQRLVQPGRLYKHDAWGNVLSETNGLGYTTDYEYNFRNQQAKKILPAITVVNEHGVASVVRPTTVTGYDKRGFKIGVTNANGYTEAFVLDAAGQLIQHVLADGLAVLTQWWDGLGRIVKHADGRSMQWQHEYDANNNQTKLIRPSGITLSAEFNELNLRKTETDGAGQKRKYDYDAVGNISRRIEAGGQSTTMEYDRNRQLLRQSVSDSGTLSWERDAYFGYEIRHTDLGGAVITYTRDKMWRVVAQTSVGGDRGQQLFVTTQRGNGTDVYLPYLRPVTNQNLRFTYSGGRVSAIQDFAQGKVTYQYYDLEGNRTRVTFYSGGELLRDTRESVNALGWRTSVSDMRFTMVFTHDPMGNIRMQQATLYREGQTILVQTRWNKFDVVGRALIDGGLLYGNGLIGVSRGQGLELAYRNGYRWREIRIDAVTNNTVSTQLIHNADGLLTGTEASDNKITAREYNTTDRVTSYREWFTNRPNQILGMDSTYNVDGALLTMRQIGMEGESNTEYHGPLKDMTLPAGETVTYPAGNGIRVTDNLPNFQYVRFEGWELSSVSGQRTITAPGYHATPSPIVTAARYYDGNGIVSGEMGAEAPEPRRLTMPPIVRPSSVQPTEIVSSFATTPEGLILQKLRLSTGRHNDGHWKTTIDATKNEYFHSVDGQYLTGYETVMNQKKVTIAGIQYFVTGQAIGRNINLSIGRNINPFMGFQKLERVDVRERTYEYEENGSKPIWAAVGGRTIFDGGGLLLGAFGMLKEKRLGGGPSMMAQYVQSASGSFPPPAPPRYVVTAGDTLEGIAGKMYHDTNYADTIAAYNGLSSSKALVPGQVLQIPQFIINTHKDRSALPYYVFVSTLLGSLEAGVRARLVTPELYPDKKDDGGGFLRMLAGIIVAVVAVMVAGPVGGMIATSMGVAEGTVGASVIIGATAGIANAVGQGLMIGLNVQKQFSMSSVLMSAVTAGVGSYVLPEGLSTPQSLSHLADQVLRVGTIAVSNQLSQMAAGYQNYFDARSLVSAITVTLAGLGVDSGMVSSFGESLGTTISQNILHGIADTGINSLIYHQQLSVMQMAAQALGTNLAAAASRPIIDNLKSMLGVEHSIGYQSAQQAGRGQVEQRGFGGVNATVRSFDVVQYSQSQGRINATTRVVNQTQTQRSLAPMVMDEFDLSITIDGSDQSVVTRFESEGARQGSLARSRNGFFQRVEDSFLRRQAFNMGRTTAYMGSTSDISSMSVEQQVSFYEGYAAYTGDELAISTFPMPPVARGAEIATRELLFFEKAAPGLLGGSGLRGIERFGAERLPNFASRDLLEGHFGKHGSEFKGAYDSASEYLKGAHDVISQGTKVAYQYQGEIRIGYVKFMGNTSKNGAAKFEFVGTNNKGNITTYHVESGKDFWKLLNGNSQDKNITPYDYSEFTHNNPLRL